MEQPKPARRQCTGISKLTGERCKLPPIQGGEICAFHGGSNPLVVHQAKLKLLAMVEPAFEYLFQVMSDDLEETENRLKAAYGILNRCGYHEKSGVVHERGEENIDFRNLTKEEIALKARELANVADRALDAERLMAQQAAEQERLRLEQVAREEEERRIQDLIREQQEEDRRIQQLIESNVTAGARYSDAVQ